ncbi:GTPase Der [Symbiodinium microadriaticum]|uniref:GTPase Der n=1 Tax=Symbiodinium microadriaticum TaxID=2951 RepID=A0A1Q9E6P1_SYMMI|nr:GTPase Der [Symbiodinium microadriaticum]
MTEEVIEAIDKTLAAHRKHVPTNVLNEAYNSKRGRIYYATQVATEPPQILNGNPKKELQWRLQVLACNPQRPGDDLDPIPGGSYKVTPKRNYNGDYRPLPPPPWQPDAEEAQKPLEPGQRVVLRGLVDYPDFNGTEGIVQRFDSTLQVYEVRVRDGQKIVLVKVACHHVSRSDSAEESQEEPPLSLALPLQDEEQILSPPNNRSAVTRTSRSSRHTRSTKSSHVETLESLHINEGKSEEASQ